MKIVMAHGSGGDMTSRLVSEIFANAYGNEYLSQMEDSTILPGHEMLAFTTDSFVVDPLRFPGGDIGRLAVCGTVNDLLMRGAKPKYLSCGFILEEGLDSELLKEIVYSMAEAAKEAGVFFTCGDTKVVEGNGGMYINTSGIGFVGSDSPAAVKIKEGDAVLVSGTVGDHHSAILSARLSVGNEIVSDVAPLTKEVECLLAAGIDIHAMRDVTRGGLATVLSEMCQASGKCIEIEEELIPVKPEVKGFASLMGLEPCYMGNEGKMIVVLPYERAEQAIELLKQTKYGKDVAIIGRVIDGESGKSELYMKTLLGGTRILGPLAGEGLPRIC